MLTVQEIVNERNETGGSPNIKEVTKEGKRVLKLIHGGPDLILSGLRVQLVSGVWTAGKIDTYIC